MCRLGRWLRYKPGNLPPIANENNFLAISFNFIEHAAEAPCDLADGQRLHVVKLRNDRCTDKGILRLDKVPSSVTLIRNL